MNDLFRIISRQFMKNKRKSVSTLAIIITFVVVYSLIMPAVTLERKEAENEPGIELEEIVSGDAMAEAEPVSFEADATPAEESEAESESEDVSAAEEIVSESDIPAAAPAADGSVVNNGSDAADTSEAVQNSDADVDQGLLQYTDAVNGYDGYQSAADSSADPSVSDADQTDAEEGMPAQIFEQTVKFNELIDEEGNIVEKQVKVKVDAEENAFPAGAVMKAEVVLNNIDPQRLQDMEDAIEAAVKKAAGESGLNADNIRVVQYQAINITFFDKEGRKIEPAKQVAVRITSDKICEIENPVLVHVNENDQTGDIKNADVIEKNEISIIDEEPDSIENNENTMLFRTARFSPFVIVESEIDDGNGEMIKGLPGAYGSDDAVDSDRADGSGVLMISDGDYNVTVTYSAAANIPANAELQVKEITEASRAYQSYMEEAKDILEDDAASINYAKIFDVDIVSDGEVVTPEAEVDVNIAYNKSDEIEEGTVVQAIQFGEGTPAVNDDALVYGDETHIDGVQMKSVEIPVTAIVGTGTITVPFVAGDGRTYEVTVTYGEDAGIPAGSTLAVSELREGSEEYQDYLEQTADAVGTAADALNYIKILDISIMNGEEEVVIQAPVDVQIKLLDKDNAEGSAGEKTKVVHFGESETDVIDPDLNGTTVNFEAAGFSYYAVTTYGATSDLAGKSYAIVWVKTVATDQHNPSIGNHTVYRGRALATDPRKNNTGLGGVTVKVETHESGLNLVPEYKPQIVEWKFESAEESDTYYIKAPNGQYLNLSGDGSLKLSGARQALTVTAGNGDYKGKVRISRGARSVQSSMDAATTKPVNNDQYFYNGDSNAAGQVYLTLCECEVKEFKIEGQKYSGEKISVQDLVNGNKYLIYRTIYNETTKKYEDWIIDGDGKPVRAYDQGGSLSLYSDISPMWTLDILEDAGEHTGYYIFRNEETGMVLHPLADGTLVKKYDDATSPATDGVSLKGREGGAFTSTIEYWDESAMAYYGYRFTTEDGVVDLKTGTGDHSQAFSFAEEKTSESGLHEVSTIDSSTAGVTIHMFDYPDRKTIEDVTGSGSYAVGVLPDSHIHSKLVAGYPLFTTGKSGATLFAPNNGYCKGKGNHLFLESVFNATGYYEYSSFNNFAHYNEDGTFTVYQETGTPNTDTDAFFYKRGNFLPYNELDSQHQTQNLYAGNGTKLDYENPNYESTLYGVEGAVNYHFGMTMEFNFLIPKNGYDNGNPLVYEFNGDDDLWIFIDDVLVLDIGGVHDAFPGTINFATGDITGGHGGAGGAGTIKECFKNANVFPDGTKWDDNKVDQYFKGNTFKSNGSHKFNMFYMEHGEAASNLQTRFNLPVIKKGNVTVEKKLDNTSQVDYANVSFAYQAFAKDEYGNPHPLKDAVYEGTNTKVQFHDDVSFGQGKVYDNVFYLKPGEAAVFSNMIEDEPYYVQELGINDKYYDQIFVNDVQIVGEQVIKEDGIYKSTEATARSRARVTFTNHCDEKNTNELRITKRLADKSEDNGDTFEFRVMLENANGELSDYYQGTYYIRDDAGVYYRYDGGRLVSNDEIPYPCAAGNNGTIAHIPPNYTVVIKDLVAGTDFYVDEIRVRPNGSSSDVLLANSDWILQRRDVSNCDAAEIKNVSIYDYASGTTITGDALGRIAWNKDAQVVFTNKLASVDVQLKKVREDGTTTISGSVFDLHKYGNSWTSVRTDIEPGKAASGTTHAVSNPVDLGELGIGRYRLTETKAPDGYIILAKHIYFQVYRDTDGSVKARLTDEAGTALDSPADMAAIDGPGTGDTPAYTITVKNTPGAVLPNTGGPGTLPYTLSGLMLVIASVLMYSFKMRRREEK